MSPDVKAILSLEVPLIVLLGERTLRVSEVCALGPGAIIELPKGADEELTLLVNNKSAGSGTAVKVGENFGIKITYIGDVRSRIAALGDDAGIDRGPASATEPPAAGGGPDGAGDELSALAESMLSK